MNDRFNKSDAAYSKQRRHQLGVPAETERPWVEVDFRPPVNAMYQATVIRLPVRPRKLRVDYSLKSSGNRVRLQWVLDLTKGYHPSPAPFRVVIADSGGGYRIDIEAAIAHTIITNVWIQYDG